MRTLKLILPALLLPVLMHLNAEAAISENAANNAPDPSITGMNPILILGADAVVRYDKRSFEVRGPGRGRLQVHKMVTILNSDGLSHASVSIPYNNFISVGSLNATIYDSDGERIRRVRGRDFDDESLVSGYSLAEDSRHKTTELVHNRYPYTIEIEYRLDFSGFIQLPLWIPIDREKTSLQYGRMEVTIPESMNFDFRSYNIPDENLHVVDVGRNRVYAWSLQNLTPVERELMGPPWFELFPALVMRPDEFSMERQSGTMRSWEDYASWFTNLWRDRDALPDHVMDEVNRLKSVAENDRQLIDMIYRYVQGNTRYVSIQLGIGGLQTETAIITSRNRYGDCKALSNYLLGMLRYAGFEAYPALIRNGSFLFPFDTNFVHDPFNHVVVMVPLNGEQIWLEATSSTFPSGYIGSSNSNRHALVFGKPEGELVRTPRLTYRDNYQIRHATVTMQSDGSAELMSETQYGGSQHESIRYLQGVRGTNRDRAIRNMIPYSSFDIVSESIQSDSLMPTAVFEKKLQVASFATRLGSRLMFHPNLFERGSSFLPALDDRSQPVYTGSAYHDLDEITIMIPESHDVEAIPEGLNLEFEFGEFSASVAVSDDGRSLLYRRELIMRPGVLPAEEYRTFREFINERIRHDNSQVVLVARTGS